jgi:hypothetical protein
MEQPTLYIYQLEELGQDCIVIAADEPQNDPDGKYEVKLQVVVPGRKVKQDIEINVLRNVLEKAGIKVKML